MSTKYEYLMAAAVFLLAIATILRQHVRNRELKRENASLSERNKGLLDREDGFREQHNVLHHSKRKWQSRALSLMDTRHEEWKKDD